MIDLIRISDFSILANKKIWLQLILPLSRRQRKKINYIVEDSTHMRYVLSFIYLNFSAPWKQKLQKAHKILFSRHIGEKCILLTTIAKYLYFCMFTSTFFAVSLSKYLFQALQISRQKTKIDAKPLQSKIEKERKFDDFKILVVIFVFLCLSIIFELNKKHEGMLTITNKWKKETQRGADSKNWT